MLFQMGNTQSEWTGLRLEIPSGTLSDGYYELEPISISNDDRLVGVDQIAANRQDNSDFSGYMKVETDGATVKEFIYIIRETEREEQTTEDESVIRIERARILDGVYYSFQAESIPFEITLTGALSGFVTGAGVAMASIAALMAF